MKSDRALLALLSIIAAALCLIAIRLWVYAPPTHGDWIALRDIQGDEARKEAYAKWMKSLPVVRVQGGQVDSNVTGTVSIDR